MLTLSDFFHLPQLDDVLTHLVVSDPGLTIVAGLDSRPASADPHNSGFLPSGRTALFRILMHELLEAHPAAQAMIITDDPAAFRGFRRLGRRVYLGLVAHPLTCTDRIAEAVHRRPAMLFIDQMNAENAPAVLEAARGGLHVLTQLNTVFRGAGVARHLLDLGVPKEHLAGLVWVVAVQRMATLCPHCKQPLPPDAPHYAELHRRCPDAPEAPTYFRPAGCADCDHTGRQGDVAVFDIFRAPPDPAHTLDHPSLLPAEEYACHLASQGKLAPNDVLRFDAEQMRRTYQLFTAGDQALVEANAAMTRKLAEIEAANRVLEQRTEALISLHDLGQALITTTDLHSVAPRVCRRTLDLCGADRAALYYLRSAETAEVLAVGGWDPDLVSQQVDASRIFGPTDSTEPEPFNHLPPGISVPGKPPTLRAGLRVPLVAQDRRVGAMIVQSTRKPRFAPGEVALLQTLANQAALAIQRAGLIEERVQKERMERELELARQVQQSVLPRTFPEVPDYRFAARNEPARQVGGDFYDVIALDPAHFGVVIADVSDKGMPAALYMALTRSLILAESRRERSPKAVLSNVNRLLLELGQPNMFVTVFYAVVEQTTRMMTYTRAGHDRPLLLREGEIRELQGRGAALGVLDEDDLHLSEEQVVLEPGDRLILYTDGMIDVLDPQGALFGRERLVEMLASHTSRTPASLCETTFDALRAYQAHAPQYDDMTMVIVAIE
ncbi:MAG: SpoIIE family protein phosphatase [Anaerolineae bacterium]|nr:SpoIIE family protein phosphatase [Anaerolineae bacterium]